MPETPLPGQSATQEGLLTSLAEIDPDAAHALGLRGCPTYGHLGLCRNEWFDGLAIYDMLIRNLARLHEVPIPSRLAPLS